MPRNDLMRVMQMRMFLYALPAVLLAASEAGAQTCTSLPNVFSAGTVAEASKVNENFSYIVNCFAKLSANTFTGPQTLPGNPTANLQAATKQYVDNSSSGAVFRSYLAGLNMSTAGGSASLAVAAGQATNSTNTATMSLSSALTKTTSAWAVGNNQGGLDSGTVATNTWYHVYLIKRTDTGIVEVLFSTSATSPTLPTSYTLFRRIGSARTNGFSQWTAFTQAGDYFRWSASVLDVDVTNPGNTAATRTLTVPTGVNVFALVNLMNLQNTNPFQTYLSDLAANDEAASTTTAPLATVNPGSGTSAGASPAIVRTNTSAQIRSRSNNAGGADIIRIATLGWWDRRGQDN